MIENQYFCRPSTLRKLHDSIADPKYEGKRTTRREIQESDEELGSDEQEEDEDISEDEHSPVIEDDLPSESEASDAPEHSVAPSHHSDSEPPDDLTSTLRKTRDEDRRKGKAVSRQIVRTHVAYYVKTTELIFDPCQGHLGYPPRRTNTHAKVRDSRKQTTCGP